MGPHKSDEEIVLIAKFLLDNKTTIRQTAKLFGLGKSTLHTYMTVHLKTINSKLAQEVQTLFDQHTIERAKRGGMATRRKYELKILSD